METSHQFKETITKIIDNADNLDRKTLLNHIDLAVQTEILRHLIDNTIENNKEALKSIDMAFDKNKP